jgi:tuberous sclerosis protein 2
VTIDPSFFAIQLSPYPSQQANRGRLVKDRAALARFLRSFDRLPVIDTHKVGVLYVAPGQTHEDEILLNTHGSPAYTRFLEGLGRLMNLRDQKDVYTGELDPNEDGEYAYAWWDDIGQIVYHVATLMPSVTDPDSEQRHLKKKHVGNDFVRIVWNDSGAPYAFDTLTTQIQFINIVIEPHSAGTIGAFSTDGHEHEYFRVSVQRAQGMERFSPIGDFKLVSAQSLPGLVRQLSLHADWFAMVWQTTEYDKKHEEVITNWRSRLQAIRRFANNMNKDLEGDPAEEGVVGRQEVRDFSSAL